jgi:hypothetical protein
MIRLLDDVRERLLRTFQAADGSFAFAVSGTARPAWKRALRT